MCQAAVGHSLAHGVGRGRKPSGGAFSPPPGAWRSPFRPILAKSLSWFSQRQNWSVSTVAGFLSTPPGNQIRPVLRIYSFATFHINSYRCGTETAAPAAAEARWRAPGPSLPRPGNGVRPPCRTATVPPARHAPCPFSAACRRSPATTKGPVANTCVV